jgi:putative transposase
MARYARLVSPDMVLHVTARGSYHQAVFHAAEDYQKYLHLLEQHSRAFKLDLLGWCLMTNHVHLFVRPEQCESLTRSMKRVQSEYAFYVKQKRQQASGHLWQSRFYSCPVDGRYVWMTLRYIELNPVRAQIVKTPGKYSWSSARYHVGRQAPSNLLESRSWQEQCAFDTWREALCSTNAEEADMVRIVSQKRHRLEVLNSYECWKKTQAARLWPDPPGGLNYA